MRPFHEIVLEENAPLLERNRKHPFVVELAEGTIPKTRLLRWLAQDYLFIRRVEQFLGILSARAPKEIRRPFQEAILTIHGENELFEEIASRNDLDLTTAQMTFICHAYVSFLLSTVTLGCFEEGLAVCYAGACTYRQTWLYAKENLREPNPWKDLIEIWTSDGYGDWVGTLQRVCDSMAEQTRPSMVQQMRDNFRITLHYELRFWDMAMEDRDW